MSINTSDDEELIFDDEDDYVFPDGPKLSAQERAIHALLLATTLRFELEGGQFVDERQLLKLDEIMKPLIGNEVRRHPRTPADTEQATQAELRRLYELIGDRLA